MDLGLRDRVYLVTGASRGLGFAAAQALVADGARVVLSAPHETTGAAAAAGLTQDAATADTATWVAADNADPARRAMRSWLRGGRSLSTSRAQPDLGRAVGPIS